MTVSGGLARVTYSEWDLSTRVPGFKGVYGAITFPAKRGPLTPQLVTSESDLLKKFTPDADVGVGFDLGYYSAIAFLEKSNKLWVRRVVGSGALYGGSEFLTLASEGPNAVWSAGESDPSARTPSANEVFSLHASDPGDWDTSVGIKIWLNRIRESIGLGTAAGNIDIADGVAATGVMDLELTFTTIIGSQGNITINLQSGGVAGSESVVLVGTTMTVSIEDGVSTHAQITAAIQAHALIATAVPTNPSSTWTLGAGTDTVTLTGGIDPSESVKITQSFANGEPVRFALTSSGSGDALPAGMTEGTTYYAVRVDATHIQLANTEAQALAGGPVIDLTDTGQGTMQLVPLKEVGEPGAFKIEVFRTSNTVDPVESWEVSRTPGSKNGFGQNNYIEDMLLGSMYIRAEDNVLNAGDPYPQVPILWLAGGADGAIVTDTDMISAADDFLNKGAYPVTVFLDAGWTTVAYQGRLDYLASHRTDSVQYCCSRNSDETNADYLNKIVDYVRNELNLGSSYSIMFTPHVQITDKYNSRTIFVSQDGYAGAALSETALSYEMWYPVAGFKRGKLNVEDTRIRFSEGEMSFLYDNGINPIRFYPGKGIMIWGQKTLLGRPSALDRANVRLLLIVIGPAISEFLEDFLFDLNTDQVWSLAESAINDYMNTVKARRGVYDFYTQIDEDNNTQNDIDNHIMNVRLFIKPTISLEYIPFQVVITRTGVSLQLVAEQM